MRWLAMLIVVVGCSQKVPRKPWTPPPPMAVEDVATWFMKAALSGDDSTARTLTLRSDQIALISKKADPVEWDQTVKDTLDQLAREGNDEDIAVTAKVLERRRLTPAKDEKVLVDVDIALVELTVNGHASPAPWLFIWTAEGWKFSPKN